MTPFRWYLVWKLLALMTMVGVVYCLAQISVWAIWAVAAMILFRALDFLGEEEWKQHCAWEALRSGFAKLKPEPPGDQQ